MYNNHSGRMGTRHLRTVDLYPSFANSNSLFQFYQIPEQLADTDFLNFSINVTLPNLTHYSELSTYLPSFNQVFNLTQYVTMDKLLVQGPMSNVSLVVCLVFQFILADT